MRKNIFSSAARKFAVLFLGAVIALAAAVPAVQVSAHHKNGHKHGHHHSHHHKGWGQHKGWKSNHKPVKVYNKFKANKGYTLFAPNYNNTTYLIDNKGKVRHTWTSEYEPGLAVYLLENGYLVRTISVPTDTFNFGGSGGGVEILDWDSNVVWRYEIASATQHHHHDVNVLPNGNILLLAWESKTEAEALAAGVNPDNLDPATGTTWSEFLVEVDPSTGETVWEWHLWDHMVQDADSSKANYGGVADNPQLVNANYYKYATKPSWAHSNAIDYNAELDQIMISARHFSEFWVIDHSTTTEEAASHSGGERGRGGDLLYRWGNPEAYDSGTEADRQLFLQHNPHWIRDGLKGEGNILIFNNGSAPVRPYSSVLEIEPAHNNGDYLQNSDGTFKADVVWEYTAPEPTGMFAPYISGAQRLPNGNTLICLGPTGEVKEVTRHGKLVWHFESPIADPSRLDPSRQAKDFFRANKYPVDYPAFDGKKLTPKGIIKDPTP